MAQDVTDLKQTLTNEERELFQAGYASASEMRHWKARVHVRRRDRRSSLLRSSRFALPVALRLFALRASLFPSPFALRSSLFPSPFALRSSLFSSLFALRSSLFPSLFALPFALRPSPLRASRFALPFAHDPTRDRSRRALSKTRDRPACLTGCHRVSWCVIGCHRSARPARVSSALSLGRSSVV